MMVARLGRIRELKQAIALMNHGATVELLATGSTYGEFFYHASHRFSDANQLRETVKNSVADLFHVHNEPDWFVSAIREVTDKPIVFDVHDLASLRSGKAPTEQEVSAFRDADAIVHNSEAAKAAAEKWHGNGKPNIVFYPYVNKLFIGTALRDVSWNSICYEGGLSGNPTLSLRDGAVVPNYRKWDGIVDEVSKQGYHIDFYPAFSFDHRAYPLGPCTIHEPLSYPALMSALRPHGFGLVGAPVDSPLVQTAMPNKLFEYISQGVVPIIINAAEASRFCAENGDIGIDIDGFDYLDIRLSSGERKRKRILDIRKTLAAENHISRLIGLYREVL
jgi:hypothetical protein